MSNFVHVLDLDEEKIKVFKTNEELVNFINELTQNFKDLARNRYFFCANSEQARNIIHYQMKKGDIYVKQ